MQITLEILHFGIFGSTFSASLTHVVQTAFDGTTTHSGSGTSTTMSFSSSKHYLDTTTNEKRWSNLAYLASYYPL